MVFKYQLASKCGTLRNCGRRHNLSGTPVNGEAKQRVEQVMRFLAEVARRRSPVVRRWTDHNWVLDLATLPQHPSVRVGQEADDGSVVLWVKRPKETACDQPPSTIADWVLPGWASPEGEAQVQKTRNVEQGEATVTVAFAADPGRVATFEAWREKRDKWAAAEQPVRRVSALFQRLFELRGRLERESERLVLFAGDGMLRWNRPDGVVEHPLLLHRLELRFEPKVPSFELRYTSDSLELNTALLREFGVDGRALAQMRERLSQSDFSLLDPKAKDYLVELVHRLFQDGVFVDGEPAGASEKPSTHRHAVVMLAPRSGGIINAIDGFLERLSESNEIPEPLISVVMGDSGIGDADDDAGPTVDGDDVDGAVNGEVGQWKKPPPIDLLLTKPANPEQQAVVHALARRGKVVVQGPPGTGKSHTIANLIGHLLAEGKSVLVTSHSTKALRVLRDKVSDDLRPLCVAVLDRDSESQHLLESSVKGIITGLQRPRSERAAEAQRSQKTRERLMEQIRTQEGSLRRAVRDEYDDIVIGGRGLSPSSAARQVRTQRPEHEWLPGPLEPGVLCPLTDDEVRDLYRIGKVITPKDETDLAAGLPAPGDVIRPADFEKALAVVAEAQSKAVDPRPEIWSAAVERSLDDVRSVLSLAVKIVKGIRSAPPLQLECIDCGRLGGTRREPWDDLIQTVERVAADIDRNSAAVVKHSPSLHPRWPREQAVSVLDPIIQHTQTTGRLSLWARIRHPIWLLIQRTSRVRGISPTTREDFEAIRSLILRDRYRDELVRRWNSQVGAVAAPTRGNLGSRPEDTARHHLAAIREALAWHSDVWNDFERRLDALGVSWQVAKELLPPRADAGGELRRWADAIEKMVVPSLQACLHELEAQVILSRLAGVHAKLAVGREGSIGRALAQALTSKDGREYAVSFHRYAELVERRAASEKRDSLLQRLAPLAPRWSEAIRNREAGHHAEAPASDASAAWLWRQLEQEITRRAATDINAIQKVRSTTQDRLQEETSRYVSARVWERQHARAAGPVRSALISWLQTVSQRGFQSGLRSERLKAEARRLLNEARAAVPVWIMPLARVVESYDFKVAQFDVVILDEASQCDMTGLVALGIAKSAIIVGDDKQVSPMAVAERVLETQTLIDEFLDGVLSKHLYTGRLSMYDLATAGFGQIIRLVEHFRCVNEIIQFSNHLSYDGEIKPLRESSRVLTRPFIVSHRVPAGERVGHVNEAEARELVSLIVAMCEQPEYAGKTVGVISMFGEEQAMLVDRLLREQISETVYAAREILCGIAPQFQGDERDIVFLSLVDHAPDGPLRLRGDDDLKKRYNVAASRARDQLWVVHSLNPDTDLKEGDLRKRLLNHAKDPAATHRQLQEQSSRVESEFERLVLKSLTASGYKVETQWRVGAFRIDMVVFGAEGSRVALECDGDRFHRPDDLERDLDRQQMLERLGWQFVRIRGSEFFRDPDASMFRVRTRMAELGVEPIGAEPASSAAAESSLLRDRIVSRAETLRREWEAVDESQDSETSEAESSLTSSDAKATRAHGLDTDANGRDASAAVLAAIREARVPIARADILQRSGISSQDWLPAIRRLLDDGVISRQGTKRGARYTVAPVADCEPELFSKT
jgi:very-short-patch-repair endonuclease